MSDIKSYLVAMDTLEKSMRAQVDALEEVFDVLGNEYHGQDGVEEETHCFRPTSRRRQCFAPRYARNWK